MARNYVFTSYLESNFEKFKTPFPGVHYSCAQLERCPTTKKLHIQGYVQLTKRLRYGGVKDLLGDPALHLEEARGTPQQNLEYCTKEETRVDGPWIHGTPRTQGCRTDLAAVRTAILDESATLLDIITDHAPVIARYPRFVETLYDYVPLPSRSDLRVLFYYGPIGTGKTLHAYRTFPDLYELPSYNPEWWPRYTTQSVVLFDDLQPDSLPRHRLLRLCDRYPLQVPTKGGYRPLHATTIIITSNSPLSHFDPALQRRISETLIFSGLTTSSDVSGDVRLPNGATSD